MSARRGLVAFQYVVSGVLSCLILLSGTASILAQDQPAEPKPPAEQPAKQPQQQPKAEPATPPAEGLSPIYEKGRVQHEDGTVSVFYRIGQRKAGELQKIIAPFLSTGAPGPAGKITISDEFHVLIVKDKPKQIELVEQVINSLVVSEPQVKIDIIIAEITRSDELQFGFEATYTRPNTSDTLFQGGEFTYNPTDYIQSTLPGATSPYLGSTFNFFSDTARGGIVDTSVRMMQAAGTAEILSNPSVVVHSGEEAELFSGEEVPYAEARFVGNQASLAFDTKYAKPGIKLLVTPHVVGENHVDVNVYPEVSTVKGFKLLQQGTEAPELIRRYTKTHVTVRSGQEIVIGGLLRKEYVLNERGIPILMDIPLLGWLFKRHESTTLDTEIVFILTPEIIKPGSNTNTLVVPRFDKLDGNK